MMIVEVLVLVCKFVALIIKRYLDCLVLVGALFLLLIALGAVKAVEIILSEAGE